MGAVRTQVLGIHLGNVLFHVRYLASYVKPPEIGICGREEDVNAMPQSQGRPMPKPWRCVQLVRTCQTGIFVVQEICTHRLPFDLYESRYPLASLIFS